MPFLLPSQQHQKHRSEKLKLKTQVIQMIFMTSQVIGDELVVSDCYSPNMQTLSPRKIATK